MGDPALLTSDFLPDWCRRKLLQRQIVIHSNTQMRKIALLPLVLCASQAKNSDYPTAGSIFSVFFTQERRFKSEQLTARMIPVISILTGLYMLLMSSAPCKYKTGKKMALSII